MEQLKPFKVCWAWVHCGLPLSVSYFDGRWNVALFWLQIEWGRT